MLICFRIRNYRSIGEEAILSLVPAARQKEFSDNILSEHNQEALNVVAIYGANASGKTNLIRGLNSFLFLLKSSSRQSSISLLDYQPFRLRKGYDSMPTMMEITFVIDDRKYRYGIEYSENNVVKEWLLKKDAGRETPLFTRDGEIIEPSSPLGTNKAQIDLAISITKPNSLFLSMCDSVNIDEAKKIVSYLNGVSIINGLAFGRGSTRFTPSNSISIWQDDTYGPFLQNLFSKMCVGVKKIMIEKEERREEEISLFSRVYEIKTRHSFYDENGHITENYIDFNMREAESSGTQQAFNLIGPVIKTLKSGGVLAVDEIESKLHPVMTLGIIDLFLKNDTNPNKAQLIFTTHDTNLLSYADLRRDQIYFMEKKEWESSDLFSLSDFVYYGERNGQLVSEKERVDTDKEKRYIEGRYGAIPMLGDFKNFVKSLWQNEEQCK